MPYHPTILTVGPKVSDGQVTGLQKRRVKIPSPIEITPAADPTSPYRQDGMPRYPESPPFAVRANSKERAHEAVYDLFETLLVPDRSGCIKQRRFDRFYSYWVNNMTNLSLSQDGVEAVIPQYVETGGLETTDPVYPDLGLRDPDWVVAIDALWWEEQR